MKSDEIELCPYRFLVGHRDCARCRAEKKNREAASLDGRLRKALDVMTCETCGGLKSVCVDRRFGFDAGNYASAYETDNLWEAEELRGSGTQSEAFQAAFVLGFFSSHERDEIPYDVLDVYDEALNGEHGVSVLKHGYIDSTFAETPNREIETKTMARKSTIAFAQKTLTPEEFAAWEAMPVKLSKKQLEAGEKPPEGDLSPAAKTSNALAAVAAMPDDDEYDLVGGITLAAMKHGQETEPEVEVADLQTALIAFWECMDKGSRERAFENQAIIDLLEDEPDESDDMDVDGGELAYSEGAVPDDDDEAEESEDE